jgi:hypothetical protein
MATGALREAIRTGRPFKITMVDGRALEVPRSEFAMISGSGRIFYVAKPNSDLFEAFDVFLSPVWSKKGNCLAVSERRKATSAVLASLSRR